MVDAYIERTPSGTYRVMVKRAKHKWWFELGKHPETDAAFTRALADGTVGCGPKSANRKKNCIFPKKITKNYCIIKIMLIFASNSVVNLTDRAGSR